MSWTDKFLGVNEETEVVMGTEELDIFISGLTEGRVKLQVLFKNSKVGQDEWMDYPDASFNRDISCMLEISEAQVRLKLVGVLNNDGVYVRLGRYR